MFSAPALSGVVFSCFEVLLTKTTNHVRQNNKPRPFSRQVRLTFALVLLAFDCVGVKKPRNHVTFHIFFTSAFSPPETRHFTAIGDRLHGLRFFLGIPCISVSLALFLSPSFRRHRIVAQPRQWMRLHMFNLCGVD